MTTAPGAPSQGATIPEARASCVRALSAWVARDVAEAAAAWFAQKLVALDARSLPLAYVQAGRKLAPGPQPQDPAPEASELVAHGLVVARRWTARDAGRAAMLLAIADREPAALGGLVADLFYKGDSDERCVVLHCLYLFPEPARFDLIATDAARSHVQPVFEALACENVYPSRNLSELAFNQLVMKCLFTGVALERVAGLEARRNPELRRMALDYAAERRAAGRTVPSDLHLVTS